MAVCKVMMIVRPQRAEVLCQRLLASGVITDLVAAECRGYGRQKGHLEDYQGGEHTVDFLPKVVVTGFIEEERKDEVADLVCSTCRTGRIGDGKIFFLPVAQEADLEGGG
jgi:nitrogen regulatory protein P-II 1